MSMIARQRRIQSLEEASRILQEHCNQLRRDRLGNLPQVAGAIFAAIEHEREALHGHG